MQRTLSLLALGVAVGFAGTASAQGLGIGGGAAGAIDQAQVQQQVQERMQQRVQAQAEAQAQIRAQAQAQQAAERIQQRAEAQAQNQANRVGAQAERAAATAQQRAGAAMERRVEAGATANANAGLGIGRSQVEAGTQIDAEASAETPPFGPGFSRLSPFGDSRWKSSKPNEPTKNGESKDDERPNRGLAVGLTSEATGQVRADFARTMQFRMAAISAMRDRAIESDDVTLLDKADRLETALRRAVEARRRGQIDAQAEAAVNAELPASSAAANVDAEAAGVSVLVPRSTSVEAAGSVGASFNGSQR